MTAHRDLVLQDEPSQEFAAEKFAPPLRNNSVHVVTLTPFYPKQGDEGSGCFIAEPLRALVTAGVENTVLFANPFYRGRQRVNAAAVPATAVRYLCFPKGFGLPSSGAFLFASVVGAIRKLHHRRPIDLIHAHGALPCGHAASLLSREFGIPYVVTVHGLDAYSVNQVKGVAGHWCQRVSRMVYQNARRVICISERVRQEVAARGDFSTEVVYNGVDTERFAPTQEIETADLVILSIGDLIPIKGHDLLLRAIAELRKQIPTARCEIVGHGPQRENLSKLAAELQIADRLVFLGRLKRKEVAEKLRRCTIFALPSSYEGLGCVYLEAMASGRPVVACLFQGIGDVIQNGENGFLVEPGNLRQLTSVLSTLLANPTLRHRIADAGQRTIYRKYTLRHQAEHLAGIYAECAR
jgi:glycosyltransferase involved in cell wall biosynthesis